VERFKVVLVGAGGMGRRWAANLRDTADTVLAGWVDVRAEGLAQAVDALAVRPAYLGPSLDEALAQVRPDFVVDATPPTTHHDVTVRALAAGAPVLGEKPMAASLVQARAMVAAAERSGQLYVVSQSRRYDYNLQALRGLVADVIGPLGLLNADYYMGDHTPGHVREMASPLLLDMAIHTFDAARYLSGAEAVSVYCEEFNPPWSWYAGPACASAIFELTGGLRFTYRGSNCSDGVATTWDAEWRAVGARGTAVWDGHGAPHAEIVEAIDGSHARLREVRPDVDAAEAEGIRGTLRDFVRALRTGVPPMGECHDNIKSVAMVFAAMESAATGRRVAVPPLWS
jgi:predicted dehydrogenase